VTLNDGIACRIIVAARCSIELKAYTSYDGGCVYPKVGYIKLNGIAVWSASWCGRYPNLRGVSILLIDPFNCSVQESRHFDTHARINHAATQLSNYLLLLNHGSITVGVTGDEPRWHLDNALPTLRQLGVEVGDVLSRGSFGFIVEKGFPRKTVLRKVLTQRESSIHPAHFRATIAGWLNTVL